MTDGSNTAGGLKLTFVIAGGVFIGILLLLMFLFSGNRTGRWEHTTEKDPMTDKVSSTAQLIGEDGSSQLELSCAKGEPVRIVFQASERTGGFSDEENYVDRMVRFRADEGPVQETIGTLGDRFIGFGKTPRGLAWDAPIIATLAKAQRLAVETETVQNGRIQMVFRVAGADDILQRLEESCAVGS